MVFSYDDPVPAAQSIYKFSRINDVLKILGGFLGYNWQDKNKIIALAKLFPREIILGQLVNVIVSPLSGLVMVLSGNMRNLINVLNNIKK